jgi:hypothetical protein
MRSTPKYLVILLQDKAIKVTAPIFQKGLHPYFIILLQMKHKKTISNEKIAFIGLVKVQLFVLHLLLN